MATIDRTAAATAVSAPRTARDAQGRRGSRARRHRLGAMTAVVAIAALGLTGCAGRASDTASASLAPADGRTVTDDKAYVTDGVTGSVPGEAPAVADGGTTSGTGDGTATSPLAIAATRSVIVTSDVSVRVGDVTAATGELWMVAQRYGATIADQVSSRGDGNVPMPTDPTGDCAGTSCEKRYPTYGFASSTTTLRVDNAKVDSLLADVARLGTVEGSSRSSSDVTAEVADVDSRVRNAEASLARVRALLARATSISDIVALEAELSRRQSDLEALQARQRTLADLSALATVTVRLFDEGAPVVAEETDSGFLAGLGAGWKAFTGMLVGGLTVLGAVLPFLLLLVPLALLVWFLVRRSGRRPQRAVTEPDTAVSAPTA